MPVYYYLSLSLEHGVSMPESLLHQLQQLRITHSLLAAQVETNRHIVAKTVSEVSISTYYIAYSDQCTHTLFSSILF